MTRRRKGSRQARKKGDENIKEAYSIFSVSYTASSRTCKSWLYFSL